MEGKALICHYITMKIRNSSMCKTFVGLVSTSESISLDEAMSSNLFSFAITHRKGNLYVSLRRFLVICYCFRG